MLTLFLSGFLTITYSQSFKELDFNKIPVPYEGKVIDAYEIHDKDGAHLYLVTKLIGKQTEIRGFKFSRSDSGYKQVWQIKDSGEEIALHFKYTKIIDIDKDGRLETIFVYQINPDYAEGSNWKIILHHKDRKYVLRAHVPELDHDRYSVKIDPAPGFITSGLQSHWELIVRELNLKTK